MENVVKKNRIEIGRIYGCVPLLKSRERNIQRKVALVESWETKAIYIEEREQRKFKKYIYHTNIKFNNHN